MSVFTQADSAGKLKAAHQRTIRWDVDINAPPKKCSIFLTRSTKEPSGEEKGTEEQKKWETLFLKKGSCNNISSFVSLIDDLRDG